MGTCQQKRQKIQSKFLSIDEMFSQENILLRDYESHTREMMFGKMTAGNMVQNLLKLEKYQY